VRLHTKLLLVLVPLIAAPMAVLGWVTYVQQRDSVEVEAQRQLSTVVDQVYRHVTARLDAGRADAILFANSDALRRYMLVDDEAQRFRLLQPSLLKLFNSYQQANPEYYEIRVLLPDGYEDTRAAPAALPNVSEEEADTAYVQEMMRAGEDARTQIVINPDNGKPVAMLSRRIRLTDTSVDPILAKPKLRGFLVTTMSLEFLQEQVDDIQTGHRGQLFFTDRGGRILFSPSRFERPASTAQTVTDDLLISARRQMPLRTEHRGEMSLVHGRELHPNLYAFAVLPEDEIVASTQRLASLTVALIASSVLITAALLYGFLRSLLLKPLARLGDAARDIGLGKSVVDVGIQRKDEVGHLATSFEEMSRRLQNSHEQIRHIAHHDSLTGLPNRRLFTQALERALVNARVHEEVLALLFLDLDDFKRVNDSLGHQAGDELLRKVAERLTHVVRPRDVVSGPGLPESGSLVSRLGGDEFIVLLTDLGEALDAAAVARRILDTLGEPVAVGDAEVIVKSSIGIAVFPQDGGSAEDLLKNVDTALYHAKEQGKNHYQYFTRALNTALLKRIVMESALRKGIARGEMSLHYQPQVDTHSGRTVGIEALLRWNNSELGAVSPVEFIPLAEETGLIVPIGEWVLNEACRQNKAWQDAGLPAVPVAVNISARQLCAAGFEETVRKALLDSELAPQYLDIELTETTLMSSPDEAAKTLSTLKALGLQISMDDFGTGYSSLSLLKRLPIDVLKIDQSFVRDLTTKSNDATIVTAIIAMAISLDLTITAEGVEQLDQLAFLRAHGCDRIQGYLISRPLPASEMAAQLASKSPPWAAGEPPVPDHEPRNGSRFLRLVDSKPAGSRSRV